jgi:two-component system, chemotaxis family, chemotaxis protein CheY
MAFNLLIVDDSPAMRSFIRRVLDISGFSVGASAEASNGEEALEVLHRQWIDVVLTDINMPKMDGEEFLRRLEGDALLRSIPVLVISTDRTETRVHRMLEMGARGYVKKPFAAETLRDELERVLGVADARA